MKSLKENGFPTAWKLQYKLQRHLPGNRLGNTDDEHVDIYISKQQTYAGN